jgi:hypothetical protein
MGNFSSTDFSTIISNNLPEIRMISGDEKIIYYNVYNQDGAPLNLSNAVCTVNIFKYGDPSYVFAQLSGSVTSGSSNQFSITFTGSGISSGVYQHQVHIIDSHAHHHYPAQGKIVIFPSPVST